MRVSIGLPVYNGENYLRASIDSILAQTYRDFELIVSDNASTDSTSQIIAEYAAKDNRIRCFRQSHNIGLSKNQNFVFAQATGEYFKWVSHDDIHAPEFVEKCVAVLDADASVVLACPRGVIIDKDGRPVVVEKIRGTFYAVDKHGNTLGRMRPPDPPRALDSARVHRRFRDTLLKTGWCLEIYGLMRTAILKRTSLNGDFYGADKPLLAEMCLHGRFFEIPEVLLYYRQHPAQEKLYRSSVNLKELYAAGKRDASFEVPRLRLLRAYCAALRRAPIGGPQSLLCFSSIFAWTLQLRKWPGLIAEFREMESSRRQELSATEKKVPSAAPRELEKSL